MYRAVLSSIFWSNDCAEEMTIFVGVATVTTFSQYYITKVLPMLIKMRINSNCNIYKLLTVIISQGVRHVCLSLGCCRKFNYQTRNRL